MLVCLDSLLGEMSLRSGKGAGENREANETDFLFVVLDNFKTHQAWLIPALEGDLKSSIRNRLLIGLK